MNRTRARSASSISRAATPPRQPTTKQIPLAPDTLERIAKSKRAAAERVRVAVGKLRDDLKNLFPLVPVELPGSIRGRLRNPSMRPARGVLVSVLPPVFTPPREVAWPTPAAYTDASGAFTIALPPVPVPDAGLVLRVRGQGASTRLSVRRIDVITRDLGLLDLDLELVPLPETEGILSNLTLSPPAPGPGAPPPAPPTPVPTLTLGEGDCVRSFQSNTGVIDRFGYSTFIRLVEPAIGERELITRIKVGNGNKMFALGDLFGGFDLPVIDNFDDLFELFLELGDFTFTDRIPVTRPISVHGFQDTIITEPVAAAKAGSLGLGYIVKMRQTWVPTGMSLGDLLYSLTLAPGEEQRIAIREQVQHFEIGESETFDLEEAQALREQLDSSASAVFRSSLDDTAHGEFWGNSTGHSFGIGAAGGFVGFASGILFGGGAAAGYGLSSTSGSSGGSQTLTRDFVSSASDELHARLSRTANARRSAARTAVRIATASDDEVHTTKIVANRNKCHALTMQYWEVLRHFEVVSEVDDVQLVCLVPLELIDFLPPGAPLELADSDQPPDRDTLCDRYARILQYAPVIGRHMPKRGELETGLRALSIMSGDPRLVFESKHGPAEDIVEFSITGTFFPNERVSVTLVTRNGARLGPFRCSGAVDVGILDFLNLSGYRSGDEGAILRTSIPLPAHVARNQVARFELTREPRPFMITIVAIDAQTLERTFGPPRIWDVSASLQAGGTYVSAFPGQQSAILLPLSYAIGADRLPPVFTYTDLLHVEALFQHVVRNTAYYSKCVWMSLSPEERVLLLEPYTIGPPITGTPGPLDEVPLLNCVANQVLGFFGNSMILPFHIPPNDAGLTTQQIQDALLTFHREGGAAARSSITLPTHGVLGEGILGKCNACEKIDLTRFWNWQDSPIPSAANPPPLPPSRLGAAPATAPSTLIPQGDITLINGMTAPDSSTNLAGLLAAAGEAKLTGDFTGQAQLSELMLSTADQAAATQKAVVDAATGFGAKTMSALAGVIANQDEIAKKQKADKQAEEAKPKTENAERVASLIANAKTLAAYVGQGADDAAKETRAKEVVTSNKLAIDKLDTVQKAQLSQAFTPKSTEVDPVKSGKTAIAKALNLI